MLTPSKFIRTASIVYKLPDWVQKPRNEVLNSPTVEPQWLSLVWLLIPDLKFTKSECRKLWEGALNLGPVCWKWVTVPLERWIWDSLQTRKGIEKEMNSRRKWEEKRKQIKRAQSFINYLLQFALFGKRSWVERNKESCPSLAQWAQVSNLTRRSSNQPFFFGALKKLCSLLWFSKRIVIVRVCYLAMGRKSTCLGVFWGINEVQY